MRIIVSTLLAISVLTAPAPADDSKPGSVTGEHLGKMLRAMGYEPQALSEEIYQVSIDREGWKVHTLLALSPDRGRIWLECKFPPIAEPARVPAAAWQRLLEENERIGPAHFVFKKQDSRVHLFQAVDNIDLSPARLRQEIDNFDRTVRKTYPVWGDDNFRSAVETLTAFPREVLELDVGSELRKLQGTWRIVALEMRGQKASLAQLESAKPTLSFEGETAILQSGPEVTKVTRVRLGGTQAAPEIDFTDSKKRVEKGIYRLDGDSLTVCFGAPDEKRPEAFATDADHSIWLLTLKRDKP